MVQDFVSDESNPTARTEEEVLHQLRLWEDQMRRVTGRDAQLNYKDEFKDFGLLDRFYRRIKAEQPIDLSNMLNELLMHDSMALVVNQIENCQQGVKARVMNYDGAYFVLEVTGCQKSFGQMYAFIESIKDKCQIREYSCKLTSLEEVFNAHASEAMYMDLNRRLEHRRSTLSSMLQE